MSFLRGRRPARPQARRREEPGPAIRSGRYTPGTDVSESPRIVRGRGLRQPAGGGERRWSGLGLVRFFVFVGAMAATVVLLLVTIAGPALGDLVLDVASSNPQTMRLPIVADVVRGRLGTDLSDPAGTDSTEVRFEVPKGATAQEIGGMLQQAGLIRDRVAFLYLVVTEDVASSIEAGTYKLRQTMTPSQIVSTLQSAPILTVTVALREGLRLEQITAYLETLPLKMDVAAFYQLATHPPESLLKDYPWIDLPPGRSLEGYLAPATYQVEPDIQPEALVRLLLETFHRQIGDPTIQKVADQGRSLYAVLTLASIVELETALDEERPLVAGVYQNRLDRKMLLNADPTVFYARDTVELAKLPLPEWVGYSFWNPIGTPLAEYNVPPELQGYQTYQASGLIPGPICTPTLSSIQAALAPDTETGFLYFVAIPNGGGRHAFAKTLAEHEANLIKYGYK